MPSLLKILFLEDRRPDLELLQRELRQGGLQFDHVWVDNEADYLHALDSFVPDLILADHSLPGYDGFSALAAARQRLADVPFIIVSGTMGEELAVEALHLGATDYVLKQRLSRVGPAVSRAIAEAKNRRNARLAELAAEKARERNQFLISALGDIAYERNVALGILEWSGATERILGWPVSEMNRSERWFFAQIHPDDLPLLNEGLAPADENSTLQQVEYRFLHRDGTYIWLSDRAVLSRNQAGDVTRITGILRDITERKNAEETLRQNEQLLRSLTARLDRLREEERTRISREIHDELGQSLTAMKMDLRWLEKKLQLELPPGKVEALAERILDACSLCDQTITSVQRIAAELRPGVLDRLGLSTALGYEAKRFTQRTGIPCEVTLPENPAPEDPVLSTTVFRIFQEALTNVARHAGAKKVDVFMSVDRQQLRLTVSDDGVGIPSEKLRGMTSLGLLGMHERAARLGGDVSFSNGHPYGTTITIRLPFSPAG